MKKMIPVLILILLLSGCHSRVLYKLEEFKHFEGVLIHYYYNKILVLTSDDGQEMTFIVGDNTVFTPKGGCRIQDFLNVGDRFMIKYFIKPFSDNKVGIYFVAIEVRLVLSLRAIVEEARADYLLCLKTANHVDDCAALKVIYEERQSIFLFLNEQKQRELDRNITVRLPWWQVLLLMPKGNKRR